MIGFLSGKILDHTDGKVLVAVGSPESGGMIGYSVLIPESGAHIGLVPGSPVELFIHTHVREDALDLFGFRTAGEKDLFLTLLSVSGIGPKLALNILSGAEPGQLISAILKADKAFLSRIPGSSPRRAPLRPGLLPMRFMARLRLFATRLPRSWVWGTANRTRQRC
jgi:Holliday junction DNA helicase RuvA